MRHNLSEVWGSRFLPTVEKVSCAQGRHVEIAQSGRQPVVPIGAAHLNLIGAIPIGAPERNCGLAGKTPPG